MEHGQKLCNFFILFLSRDRAGSKELENFYDKKNQNIIKERDDIKNRIKGHVSLDKNNKALYNSDWYYAAIHMILRCKKSIQPKLTGAFVFFWEACATNLWFLNYATPFGKMRRILVEIFVTESSLDWIKKLVEGVGVSLVFKIFFF